MLDLCDEFLKRYNTPKAHQTILYFMVHLCLRQYRRDCLASLKKDFLNSTLLSERDLDTIIFTHHGLSPLLKTWHWYSGNRCGVKGPDLLFDWIFGSTGTLKRDHFLKRPFRNCLNYYRDILLEYPKLSREWITTLQQAFFEYHRAVPVPDTNGVLVSRSNQKRVFFSIRSAGQGRWEWGERRFDTIEISYPSLLTLSRLEFEELLQGYE